jgi:translation initiation factor IF-3
MAINERRQENRVLANREIRAREVRLIGVEGENLGIQGFFKALNMANDRELDLILINPQSNPPVCKIGDLGKYKYDLQKRQKDIDKRNRENRVELKEVQLRLAIDTHDLGVKIKHIQEWLVAGDKVKIVIKFRGREMANKSLGYTIIENILAQVPAAKLEGNSEMQGNKLTAIIFQGKQK